MTDSKWQQAIKDAEALDYHAQKSDRYVQYMTDALVSTLKSMYTDDVNDEMRTMEREDLYELMKKLGNYTIQRDHEGRRINLTAEYAELDDILQEVYAS